MTKFNERGLLRIDEAAEYLGLGRTKTYELIAMHDIPVVRIGRATRIPVAALRAWVAQRVEEGA